MDVEGLEDASAVASLHFTKGSSYLQQLPAELREMIYRDLLSSSEVRRSAPGMGEVIYHFHPAIRGVNHAFELETRPLLYEKNVFVRITTNHKKIFDLLKEERVPVVSDHHVTTFRGHCLDAHLRFPRPYDGGIIETGDDDIDFLMVAQDLPRLVRMISIQHHVQRPDWSLVVHLQLRHFAISSKPTPEELAIRILPLKTQKVLLEPFKELHREICYTSIDGMLDTTYRHELSCLTQPGQISRLWSSHRLAQDVKNEGDSYFKLGKFNQALNRYGVRYMINSHCLHRVHGDFDEWRKASLRMSDRTLINIALLSLRLRDYMQTISTLTRRTGRGRHHLEPSYEAKMWHYLGLAHVASSLDPAFESVGNAIDCFKKALVLAPENIEIQASLDLFRNTVSWTRNSVNACIDAENIIEEDET